MKRLYATLLMAFMEILIFSSILLLLNSSCNKEKIVKCYDRNNNEIIGQSCINNKVCLSNLSLLLIILFASLLFLITSSIYIRIWGED